MARDVAVLVGSLRKASLNRKMAQTLRELARAALALEIVEIGDLPLYNEDLEADVRRRPGRAFATACGRPMRCCSSPPSTTARCPAC